jgi:hypothetical protein
MGTIREENYDIICGRIQELIDLLEKGAETLSQKEWDDIIKRITKLNQMLEILGRK